MVVWPRVRSLLPLCLVLVLCGVSIQAQVLYGSLVGDVTDHSGAAVPGAQVTATNPQTTLTRSAKSDGVGHYTIANLPEGTYNVKVEAQGFKSVEQTGLNVQVGAVQRANAVLEVGAVSQTVEVQAGGAQLQTEKAEVSTRLPTVAIENLPTGFYRNFQYLQMLVPGAAENLGTTGALADTPERAIAIPMNGLSPASNSTRIDGAQSTFLWKPGGGTLYIPPIEAIQEVKVTTNTYDPEKGMAGSAAVDVETKSGSNDWHATVFEYHTDQHIQAREAFDYTDYKTNKKPKQLLNDMGGNLGGPIVHNKVFFFVNWDGLFQRDNFSDFHMTVPTDDFRHGNFSKYLGPITLSPTGSQIMVPTTDGHGNIGPSVPLQEGMIFDPTTGNPDGTGRAVYDFGGQLNVMPTDIFNPTAAFIMSLWPEPNFPGQVDPTTHYVSNNFFESASQQFNRNNIDTRVDWNHNQNHLVWVKYSLMNALTYTPKCGFNATIGGPCVSDSPGRTHDLVQTSTLGHTWTLSPTLLIDGSIGFSRMGINSVPIDFGKNIGLDVLHIPGTNDPTDTRYSGAPNFKIADFSMLGSPQSWQPLYRNDWSLTNSHNATWVRGNHTLRFGADIVHHHLNHWQPENGQGPRGFLNFTRGDVTGLNTAAICNNASGTNVCTNPFGTSRDNQFAQFLLGRYDETGRTVQFLKMNGKDWEYGFHFLDRWRLTNKVTLNLGARYEYYPLMSRDLLGHGVEQYDPATNTVLLGGLGGVPKDVGIRTEKGLIAPRVGIAWQANNMTVLRGGFGITYDTFPILRELRGTYPEVISLDHAYDTSNPNFNTLGNCQGGMNVECSYQGLGTFSTGVPPVPLPNVSSGRIPIPTDVDMRDIGPGLLRRGHVNTWNLTLERKLPADMTTSVAYVANAATHLWGQEDLNASDIGQQAPLSAAWGRTASTDRLAGYLSSHYNALQATIDRHFSKGLYLHGMYTFSKAIDYNSDNAWSGGLWQAPIFAGPSYLWHDRGVADFDHRHVFRMAYVWDLPLGGGHRLNGGGSVGRAILSGWQMNGIWDTTTGSPTTVFSNPYNMQQAGNWQTVDQIAPLHFIGGLGPGQFWYDPKSFQIPPDTRFGNTGRNISLYGPRHSNLDASLFRHFKLGEKYDLQFRAEGLNVLNHPQWVWDSELWGASSFCWAGTNPRTCDTSAGFMQANKAIGHRIVKLGLRLSF